MFLRNTISSTLVSVICFGLFTACASTNGAVVVDRSNGKEKPSWVDTDQLFITEGGNTFFRGTLSVLGGGRPDACIRGADSDARASVSKNVIDAVKAESGFVESNPKENAVLDVMVKTMSEGQFAGVRKTNEYWEIKRLGDGDKAENTLTCWVRVSIDTKKLEEQIKWKLEKIAKEVNDPAAQKRLEDAGKQLESKYFGNAKKEE